jgi:hypothetical protein
MKIRRMKDGGKRGEDIYIVHHAPFNSFTSSFYNHSSHCFLTLPLPAAQLIRQKREMHL